ncbi:MAG: DJ-1/PfpI family protein [Promethearchaeota archaeon]
MKIAFVIYNGMTTLDFIGVYDPLIRLKTMGFIPDLEWEICALTETVSDINGLRILPSQVGGSLNDFDFLIIPGGLGSRVLLNDKKFLDWIRSGENIKLKISVCTGSLILGAAGYLKGKKATTHPIAYKMLSKYCQNVEHQRIVDEGDVITAGGVTSSIDLGLYLCEKLVSKKARKKIKKQIDYPYNHL